MEAIKPNSEPTMQQPTFELQVVKNIQEFAWNFAEVKAAIAGNVAKFHNLVVTEDNLKDMEGAQKEIASVRIQIDKFRKAVKKEMEVPYKKFELEIKELQQLVEEAEGPLKRQIAQYEVDRVQKREGELQQFILNTSANLGLRAEYCDIPVQSKWTNRTAKDGAVKQEIVGIIETLLDRQRRDDEAAELARQRAEMIEQLCASNSESLGLQTPVRPAEVNHLLGSVSLTEIPAVIAKVCSDRYEMEQRAADAARAAAEVQAQKQASALPAEPTLPPMPPSGPPMPPPAPPAPPIHNFEPPMPPAYQTPIDIPPAIPSRPVIWDVDLRLVGVTVQQAILIKDYIKSLGVECTPINQTKRG